MDALMKERDQEETMIPSDRASAAPTSSSALAAASLNRRITPSPEPSNNDSDTASDAETQDLPEFSNETAAATSLPQPAPQASSAASQAQYVEALAAAGPIPAILGAFDETVNAVQAVASAATNEEEEEEEEDATTALTDIQAKRLLDAEEKKDWKETQRELDTLFDKQNETKYDGIPAFVRPTGLKEEISLYQYQQDGIRWLLHQETADRIPPFWKEQMLGHARNRHWWRCSLTGKMQKETPKSPMGSILADDMGLGKTLQSICLILSNRPDLSEEEPRCTLIVSPVSVIANWDQQIRKFVKPNELKVGIYHGKNRQDVLKQVKKNQLDVVLTSYETLVSDLSQLEQLEEEKEEAKREAQKQKAKKKAKSKKAKRDEVRAAWNNSSSDSEDDWAPDDDSDDDDDDDDHYLPPSMLKKRKRAPVKQLWIFDLEFYRIILDEAHKIRNSSTNFFKSMMRVPAERKLCLTGTPFVNRPSDIHSLLAFLGEKPLADKTTFTGFVVQPIMEAKEIGLSRLRTVMSHLALRRTKALVTATIQLVSKEVIVHHVELDQGFHASTHEVLYETARAAFLSLLRSDSKILFSNFYAFLTLVLRVRQSCCSGYLVPPEARDVAQELHSQIQSGEVDISAVEGAELLEKLCAVLKNKAGEATEYDTECAVCYAELEEETAVVLRSCKHVLCESCLNQIDNHLCPFCREGYSPNDMVKLVDAEKAAKKKAAKSKKKAQPKVDGEGLEVPPKVQAILDSIQEMAPDEKGVIFSQWTSFLDIIQAALERNGHTTTRIDGSMNAHERIQAMQDFESDEDDGPRFIMCSLHACGAGISLTRGNVIWLCDAWWNASIEAQAMDRVHRIGQKRNVKVIRLIIKDSLEERMVQLQEAKSALGKGSMQKLTKEERKKARITALKDLFQVEEDLDQKWEGWYKDEEEEDDNGQDLEGFIVDDDNFE